MAKNPDDNHHPVTSVNGGAPPFVADEFPPRDAYPFVDEVMADDDADDGGINSLYPLIAEVAPEDWEDVSDERE